MDCYLDNAATTKVSENVYNCMSSVLLADFGNPSSMHRKGVDAENYIKDTRKELSRILKCEGDEIYFTSGGTEGNNLALIGTVLANKRAGKHIIVSSMEHASVYNPAIFLEEQGYELSFCPVDRMGHIDIEALKNLIRDDTVLVSCMYVNNEVGSVNPVSEIGKAVKEKNKNTIFHVDAIQAFGKFRIIPKNEGIDILTVSGHKIHGPKGSGFIYIKKGIKVKPIINGGGQEKGMRSGTENVPAIAGLGAAAHDMYENLSENREKLFSLKERLVKGLITLPETHVHALCIPENPDDDVLHEAILKTAPHIVSCGFNGVRSEVLLHSLEDKGIYVSSGSACSSNHPAVSGTLKAIGTEQKYLDSTIRFSFSVNTKEEEIDYTLSVLNDLLPILRKYRRK